MNNIIQDETISIVIIVSLLFSAGGYLFKREADKKIKLRNAKSEEIARRKKAEEEVDQEIMSIKSALFENALGYYIDVHYRKYGISDDEIKKLQEQYPRVLAMPFIDWTKVDQSGDKTYILEDKLRAILNADTSINLNELKYDFEESILKDGEKEAKSILESEAKKNSFNSLN